jgi:hypothetical protein
MYETSCFPHPEYIVIRSPYTDQSPVVPLLMELQVDPLKRKIVPEFPARRPGITGSPDAIHVDRGR